MQTQKSSMRSNVFDKLISCALKPMQTRKNFGKSPLLPHVITCISTNGSPHFRPLLLTNLVHANRNGMALFAHLIKNKVFIKRIEIRVHHVENAFSKQQYHWTQTLTTTTPTTENTWRKKARTSNTNSAFVLNSKMQITYSLSLHDLLVYGTHVKSTSSKCLF